MAHTILKPLQTDQHHQLQDLVYDLDAAAASNSRGDVLAVWQRWQGLQQDRNTPQLGQQQSLPTIDQLSALTAEIEKQQQSVWDVLTAFIRQTSFADASERVAFLASRVMPVLRQLASPVTVLSTEVNHSGTTVATLETAEAGALLSQLQACLSGLLAIEQMLPWLEELCTDTLCNAMVAADDVAGSSNNRALTWSLQQLLLQPIWLCVDDINTTIGAIVHQSMRDGFIEQASIFKQLSVLLSFAAVRWCSGLLLPNELLEATTIQRGAAINAAVVDKMAALSCHVTIAKQLAALRSSAETSLEEALLSIDRRDLSKQHSKQLKQKPLVSDSQDASNITDSLAALRTHADAAAALAANDDSVFLAKYISHLQCQAHSALAHALLQDCREAAHSSSSQVAQQSLPLHKAFQGRFGQELMQSEHAQGLSLCPAPAKVWLGILLGLPVQAAAQLKLVAAVAAGCVADRLGTMISSVPADACQPGLAAAPVALEYELLLLLDSMTSACRAAVLVEHHCNSDSSTCTEQDAQTQQHHLIHVFASSTHMPQLLSDIQAWVGQNPSTTHVVSAEVCQHVVDATAPGTQERPEDTHALQVCCAVCQHLQPGMASRPAGYTTTATAGVEQNSRDTFTASFAVMIEQHLQSVQQHNRQPRDQTNVLLYELVQQLQICCALLGKVTQCNVADISMAHKVLSACLNSMNSMKSAYLLRAEADEITGHMQHLHNTYLDFSNLAVGQRILHQLAQLEARMPSNSEVHHIKGLVKAKMGCADTYSRYWKLVRQLRKLHKFLSIWVQKQVQQCHGSADAAGVINVMYEETPKASAMILQLAQDVFGSFEVTSTSIKLVRQHETQQLQARDQQLVAMLQRLQVPLGDIDHHGFQGLLTRYQSLLIGHVSASAVAVSAQEEYAVTLDNVALRQQQKQHMLDALEQQVLRLLADAKGVKPTPGALVSLQRYRMKTF